jgi:hypothetical protein
MMGMPSVALRDVVAITDEDDAYDDISIRMRHAQSMVDALSFHDPDRLRVNIVGDGTHLTLRTHDGRGELTIGTTMGRRFDASALTPTATATILEVVTIALERYGTIDRRTEEHLRRQDAVIDCLLHDHAALGGGMTVEQLLLASPCVWSDAYAQAGGWTADDWDEPSLTLPEGAHSYLPQSVSTSIDADGRIRIMANVRTRLEDAIRTQGIVDTMGRLRLQSDVLRAEPFPPHPKIG